MGAYGNTLQASKSGDDIIRFIPGDINQDGIVDILDYAILLANWLLEGGNIIDQGADLNYDRIVDDRDLYILLKFWLW
jgi:hypothetical protein